MSGRLMIEPALLIDIETVLDVLDEAASWLTARGVDQWPDRFEPAWIEADIVAGSTWLVRDGTEAVATITVSNADPLWPDEGGSARYLHRLAVRRSHAGLGSALLTWADDRARRDGAHQLRLDCVASNADLRAYYRAAGFIHRGDRRVGGPPGSRDDRSTDRTVVALFERRLSPDRPPSTTRFDEVAPEPVVDRVMASAWPAVDSAERSGWWYRYASGVTRRANSVLAIGMPADLDSAIDGAEVFYRSRATRPAFLVSDASTPPDVPAALAARGYRATDPTWMLTGPAAAVAATFPSNSRWRVDVSDQPATDWLDTYRTVQSIDDDPGWDRVVRNHLLRPALPARFATVYDVEGDAAALAVGEVVLADEWGCLQCLGTAPNGRRRGAATEVFRTLAAVALEAQVSKVFAAVAADNRTSLALCRRAGLRPSHRYRYYVPRDSASLLS
jgi:GNAT superfamily N-acetyltransferase